MTFHDHRMPLPAAARPAARKQLGPVTLAIRAMRSAYALAPKAPTRRTGPVTEAIRTMRAAVPDFDANPDLIALRRALANRIEADIAALDMLGGDPDIEADNWTTERAPNGSLYLLGRSSDDEASLCGVGSHPDGGVWGNRPGHPDYTGGCGGDIEDLEADHADSEPSLGSLGGTAAGCTFASQTSWAGGSMQDLEQDAGDDREEENEHGTDLDAGEAGDDNGIADWQGQSEQAHRFLDRGGDLNAVRGWL